MQYYLIFLHVEQRKITESSLFFVGEMGGNDYLNAIFQNRTLDEAKTFVPGIIDAIRSSLTVRTHTHTHTMIDHQHISP